MKLVHNTYYPALRSLTTATYVLKVLVLSLVSLSIHTSSMGCNSPVETFPIVDGMNGTLGNWTQSYSDNIDWTINGGSTSSPNTGPTSPIEGSHYIYLEASGANYPSKTASIESQCLHFESGVFPYISFAYHMYGAGMGDLFVEITTDNGNSWTTLWERKGDQGDAWYYEFISLSGYLDQNVKVRFRGVTGSSSEGWQSDISLDQIVIASSVLADCSMVPVNDTITICNIDNITGSVAANDPLPTDYTNLNYTVVDSPTMGELTLNSDGTYDYISTSAGAYVDEFTYQRTYDVAYNIDLENIFFNGCGEGKIIETYVNGIESSDDQITIPNPTDFTKIEVEVWAESACGSLTIEGQPATVFDIYRTDGTLDTEKIYRATLTSISANGVININKVGTCVLSSVAAYVERESADSQGSSSLVQSNIDLYHTYVSSGDDCTTKTLPIGGSDIARDITFTVPLHEKDNTRAVDVTITAGTIVGTQTITNANAGNGAGVSIITLNDIPGNVLFVEIEVCSPDGNGDSFGIGALSATTPNCSFTGIANCYEQATAIVNVNNEECAFIPLTLEDIGSNCLNELAEFKASGPPNMVSWSWTGPLGFTSNLRSPTFLVSSIGQAGVYTLTSTDNVGNQQVATMDFEVDDGCPDLCDSPTFLFSNPALVDGFGSNVGVAYRFYDIHPGLDAKITVTAKSHAEIEFYTFDADFETYGGYEDAFQPIIDYNWINSNGSIDGAGTRTVSFQLEFFEAGTNDLVEVPLFSMTALDLDGSGQTGEINEQFEGSGYLSYSTETSTALTLSGNLLAEGPISTFDGIDETELDAMVSFNYVNASTVFFTYGATYGGSGTIGDTDVFNTDEKRYNSLYFKCFEFNSVTCEDIADATTVGDERCGEGIVTLTAAGCDGGDLQWFDEITGGDLVHLGEVFNTSLSATTTYYVECKVGNCYSTSRTPVTAIINDSPPVFANGEVDLCIGETTTLSPNSGGSWSVDDSQVAIISSNGTVTAMSEGSATFVFTSLPSGCVSTESITINVSSTPSATIDFNGTECLREDSQLTAVGAGGTGDFTYLWTGPNAFSSPNQIVDINTNGNYRVTITDISGCTAVATQYVYQQYEPTLVTSQTTVCEGEPVTISVNSSSATAYQWGSNAGASTSSSVIVYASAPATTYAVTITNGIGCEAQEQITIDAIESPIVDTGIDQEVCFGESVTLTSTTPTNGAGPFTYVWDNGLGSGKSKVFIPNGSNSSETNYDYTVFVTDSNGCNSTSTVAVNILSNPQITVATENVDCFGTSGSITVDIIDHPDRSSIDVSINDGLDYVTIFDTVGSYIFSNLTPATYSVKAKWSDDSCERDVQTVTIITEADPLVGISGSDNICVDATTNLSPTTGGMWTSSNPSVATVNNSGLVTGVAAGSASFVFTDFATGCESEATADVTVGLDGNITIVGSQDLCLTETMLLTTSGSGSGTWQSSDTNIASVDTSGLVTPITQGSVVITFIQSSNLCGIDPTLEVEVHDKPIVTLNGDDMVCEGQTTNFTPVNGGIWTSLEPTVANISPSGTVVGISPGSTTFTFKSTTTGCTSDPTVDILVSDQPSVAIDYNGSVCFTPGQTLSAITEGGTSPYEYEWTGPNGYMHDGRDATINGNGSYFLTLVDSMGCQANTSGYIYYGFIPVILNLATDICEGDVVSLSVNASNTQSFEWSDNAGGGSLPSTIVSPLPPTNTYSVTVTNSLGCESVASATVDVYSAPGVSLSGSGAICVGSTTQLEPTVGGYWTSSDQNIAIVSPSGEVTGVGGGNVSFVFTRDSTGCESLDPIEIVVTEKPEVDFLGNTGLCIGEQTSLASTTTGSWSSADTSIAIIDSEGTVTALSHGTVDLIFIDGLTSCSTVAEFPLEVYPNPDVTIPSGAELCVGSTLVVEPAEGGLWQSTDPAIATVSNSGVVTGKSLGEVSFIYTSLATGCVSDTSTTIEVIGDIPVNVTGPLALCTGETSTLSPPIGGTWESENDNIAVVTNNGIVTAVSPGAVKFIFTSAASGCQSEYTDQIFIQASPIVDVNGDAFICDYESTSLSPSTGGLWQSSNPQVATVDSAGVVTAITAGTAVFNYTETATGCSSITDPITIYGDPQITVAGPSEVCVGGITSLLPASGGIWQSNNSSIATISASGIITGITSGIASFTYTESGTDCLASASISIEIVANPTAEITGDTEICVGSTSTLSPSIDGYWISSNPSVAVVSIDGVVTGVSQGISRFTFIGDDGCSSTESSPILVYGRPQIVTGNLFETCEGSSLNLLPASGGSWVSSDTTVATITDQGVIFAMAEGSASFTFTESSTGCTSEDSEVFTIVPIPDVQIAGIDSICEGSTTNLSPSNGGVWISNNPENAYVDNNGTVLGIDAGPATFYYTSYSSGCKSLDSDTLWILEKPNISFIGAQEVCEGDTTSLSPTIGGSWYSTDTTVAVITEYGTVTALSQGVVRFYFIEDDAGCPSDLSAPLVVNGAASVGYVDSDVICVDESAYLFPSIGGSWSSSDESIATVTNSGVVTGVSAGEVTFEFTSDGTGCTSNNDLFGTVIPPTSVEITGEDDICIGAYTTLSPTDGGTWVSSNSAIAEVNNQGVVKGKASGVVTFEFVSATNGCTIESKTNPVTVRSCIAQDFNVTSSDFGVNSSVATNDNLPIGATYSFYDLVSKPIGSAPVLGLSADGSYSFESVVPGKYRYEVVICIPPTQYGCTRSMLEITVLDNVYTTSNPVANIDIATKRMNPVGESATDTIWMKSISNDKCINLTGGCVLDMPLTATWDQPSNGVNIWKEQQISGYVPAEGYVGFDTIAYSVCSDGGSLRCDSSYQVITIQDTSAKNSVIASDDFGWGMVADTIQINVVDNDGDPESDNIYINTQGSEENPVYTSIGSYWITSTGDFFFVPFEGFQGASEIIYTICDDNLEVACADATVHFIVFDNLKLSARVLLEGPLLYTDNMVTTSGKPIMRDEIRVNRYDGKNYIPISDPYTYQVNALLDFTSHYTHIGPGLLPKNQTILDSAAVFSVEGDDAIVDWVFVQIRSKSDSLEVLATRSGLLQRDGDIVDIDGVSPLAFEGVVADSFYVSVKHRSHLGVMCKKVANGTIIDFSSIDTELYDFGTVSDELDYTGLAQNEVIKPGYRALWAGDFNSDGVVKFTNPNDDVNWLFFEVFMHQNNTAGNSNFDNGLGYFNGDYDMDGRAKFTSPNDDTNLLFMQIVLYVLNPSAAANFSSFLQQIPK